MTRPSGTVTFLFTDIEGSTQLLERVGDDAYESVLAEHRQIITDRIAAHGGHVVGIEGDSFFAAFARPTEALACVLEAQRRLQALDTVRVRMGIHTGEATSTADGYIGLAVHHAARVMSSAHGGQVVVSQATHALTDGVVPDGVELRDAGLHRLKDLSKPIRLYELRHPDLRSSHPPLRTLDQRRHNLPIQTTPFTGRDQELAAARKLVADGARLVTLTGPGGIGKTRLALQVAAESNEDFADGVWFVPLAQATDAAQVPAAVAGAIGAAEAAEGTAAAAVLDQVASKKLLLVLDNLEQIPGAAAFIAQMVAVGPDVTVMATSREPLHVSAEQVYAVPAMELASAADELEAISQADSVRLFVERAKSFDQNFVLDAANAPIVSEICRRLDGLPLAIELAAARCKHVGPQALLGKLKDSLDVLGGGPDDAPDRHQTLEATIGWSYDLLTDREREIFRALSVFSGGFDAEGAEAVCGATLDDLVALADRSLIRRDEDSDEPRFELLEMVRAYATARLRDAGELDEMQRRHTEWFATLAESSRARIRGPEGVRWLNRISSDHDNLRAAIERSWLDGNNAGAARIVCALCPFWRVRGHFEEARKLLDRALEGCPDRTVERARVLMNIGRMSHRSEQWASPKRVWPLLEESLDIAGELGDKECQAYALYELSGDTDAAGNFVLGFSSNPFEVLGDPTGGQPGEHRKKKKKKKVTTRQRLEAALALAEDIGDQALAAEIRSSPLFQTGFLGFFRGIAGNTAQIGAELEAARERGDTVGVSDLLSRRRLGFSAGREEALREAVEVARSVGDAHSVTTSLTELAKIHADRCEFPQAIALMNEAMTLSREHGDPGAEASTLQDAGFVAARLADRRSLDRIGERMRELAAQGANGAKARGRLHVFVSRTSYVSMLTGFRSLLGGIVWVYAFTAMRMGTSRSAVLGAAAAALLMSLGKRTENVAERFHVKNSAVGAGMIALVAFGAGALLTNVTLAATLTFVLLTFAGSRSRPSAWLRPLSSVLGLLGIVAAIVAAISRGAFVWAPPVVALVLVAAIGFGYRPVRGPWMAGQTGAVLVRLWLPVLGMDLFARWRTHDTFDFGAWAAIATPVIVVGLVLFGVAMATSVRYAPGGILVAASAPFLPWAMRSTEPLALAIGAAFGVAWILLGLARISDRSYRQHHPVYTG